MFLDGVGMIAADTSRSRAYLQALIRHQLYPSHVLILENSGTILLPGQVRQSEKCGVAEHPKRFVDDHCWSEVDFTPDASLQNMLESACIPYSIAPSKDINDPGLISLISSRPETVLIYSGFGGALLRKEVLLSGKRFLHVHGGYLPDFKGSTTNFYSLIVNNKMGASAIFLTEEIDSGPVLLRREFPPPATREEIDHVFDSAARARVLVDVLGRYAATARWDIELENNWGGETYYVIHPLLKHIAILAKG